MNILLIGYGKMGRVIDELAVKAGHHIVARIGSSNRSELLQIDTSTIDSAIEFTNPKSTVDNIKWCFDNKIPVVVGSTGWLNHKEEIDDYCKAQNGTYLYASNFSLGVNLFFKINEKLAQMMNKQEGYEPSVHEIHHTQKLDSPSGTALSLAKGILNNLESKKRWHESEGNDPSSLQITSERVDPTPGTHIIKYESEVDSIEIKHTAHSRMGFAKGALSVAEWIVDKRGVLTMDDYLSL